MARLRDGYGDNFRILRGTQSVTGSATIATGLATVEHVTAVLAEDAALAGALVTCAPHATAGSIAVKVWKFTGAADCTPIAATVAKSITWTAMGL